MYEIRDEEGVIYSGSYEEMYAYWEDITGENTENITWSGDIELVQVLEIYR